ncbi:hypothetical protein [Actinoplanes sp. NPDC049681]|uniref:hypothetical protein n=1 Tax=Actinoplanes sp. NPDC049681 TaxID=3363905 RepID=UPI00379FEC2F
MSETWRPRPSRGVMGYVAELQQFDPVPPSVYELDPPAPAHQEPYPDYHAFQEPGFEESGFEEPGFEEPGFEEPSPDLGYDSFEEPAPELVYSAATDTFFSAPEVEPPPIVSHVRPEPAGSRMRAVVLSAAILAIISGVGIGYAAWDTTGGTTYAQPPAAATSAPPGDGPLNLAPVLPGVDPVTGAASDPTTTPPAAPTTAAQVAPAPVQVPKGTTAPAVPGLPDRPQATAEPTSPEPAETSDAPSDTGPVALPPRLLPATAVLTFAADQSEEGWTGYTGTVRVTNPGGIANRDWTVTLTVPGGNAVSASGARVEQDGESVTFTGEPVGAGETLTFTFSVEGTLTELPGGCRIGGIACS